MSEKRGYPNPDYTEEDIMKEPVEMKEEITIDETVVISPDKFQQLCAKAAALDILTARIKFMGKIEDEIVFACTGTCETEQESDAKQYERWWRDENVKNVRLMGENADLRAQVHRLQEQINQLLPAMENGESEPAPEVAQNE